MPIGARPVSGLASRRAAVLVPVLRDAEGELRLVVIRRADHGVHGGQLAFPGGKVDSDDASPLAAALREAREEIGLDPSDVEILAVLSEIETRSSGFAISPFLARVRRPGSWQPDPAEVAEVIEARLKDLTRPEGQGESLESWPGSPEPHRIRYYRVGSHRLWGATYRILEPLVPRLLAGEWSV
jgi:8-oxo-dGTP pyrophosphatase MutT (NUDIX family)